MTRSTAREETEEIAGGGGKGKGRGREAGVGPREAERDLIGLGRVQWSPSHQGGKENVPFSL